MKKHLSDTDYKRLLEFGKRQPNHSPRIGYSGNTVKPPNVLYGTIQPVSHIEGQGILPGECPTLGPECKAWRDRMMKRNNYSKLSGKGFLVLMLLVLTIILVFSGKK